MAVHAPIMGAPFGAPTIALHALPRRVRRLLATIDRDEIGDAIEVLIARLDAFDGDTDIEPDGDELDFNGAEDDFGDGLNSGFHEPGCPIADPGGDPLDWGEFDEVARH